MVDHLEGGRKTDVFRLAGRNFGPDRIVPVYVADRSRLSCHPAPCPEYALHEYRHIHLFRSQPWFGEVLVFHRPHP